MEKAKLDIGVNRRSLRSDMTFPTPTASGLTVLPVDCFARIARRRGSVWLDSSLSRHGWGSQSIMATDPIGELTLKGDCGRVAYDDRPILECDRDRIMSELESIRTTADRFAIGFVGYEATLPWLGLEPARKSSIPELHFFVYDRILQYDHLAEEFTNPYLAVRFLDACPTPERVKQDDDAKVFPTVPRERYLDKVRAIKEYIREGDIYQANYTCRFESVSQVDPFVGYLRLRRLNPAPYSAYLNFGDYQLLSSSPERMFLWDGDTVSSSPIKGTISRGGNPFEDEVNRQCLINSAKDRAELLMIVDLVRNDLGKIAVTGSVTVDHLYRIEDYSSVIHLIADIKARVRPGTGLGDVLSALLPGGSITGAPKRRAVEILSELEEAPRSAYTGSIGYVGRGRADFNIAIRTIIHDNHRYHVHAGGGIVADSQPEAEYEEMLLKARNLLKAIGAA
jgi:para-aminobenzoate synthetase component 1